MSDVFFHLISACPVNFSSVLNFKFLTSCTSYDKEMTTCRHKAINCVEERGVKIQSNQQSALKGPERAVVNESDQH